MRLPSSGKPERPRGNQLGLRAIVFESNRALEIFGRGIFRIERRAERHDHPGKWPREREFIPCAREREAAVDRAAHRNDETADTSCCEERAGFCDAVRATRTIDGERGVVSAFQVSDERSKTAGSAA